MKRTNLLYKNVLETDLKNYLSVYNPLKDNMAEQFGIKKGFVNILKQLLHDEGFIVALVNLLLGRKDAANELKIMLLRKSYRQSLNEVVVAHRLANAPMEKGKEEDGGMVKEKSRFF